MAVLQGLGHKVSGKEQECRTLQVNMPSPRPVDIEFNNITLQVSEGLTSRSKLFTIYKQPMITNIFVYLFC